MLKKKIKKIFKTLEPYFDEKHQRLLAAALAKSFGEDNIKMISEETGISRPTIYKGYEELENKSVAKGRIRNEGGGRKKLTNKNPAILKALEELIEPTTKGDPMSPLRWTCKSTRNLSDELKKQGYTISHMAVSQSLSELGYSLQANRKDFEKVTHPDRNKQFEHINELTKQFTLKNQPVISVDTKKKELIGEFKNNGREWRQKKNPQKVLMHDFPDKELGKAVPYGIYDIDKNVGWVNIGNDHDTSAFAVESIRKWWYGMGSILYPHATKLLICADSGGSNGYRVKLWKYELQKLANETGLEITIAHLPSGTSKWNKIEHKLFSHITMNWRGKPLVDYETIVNLISSTKTRKGLKVTAHLDKTSYPIGIKVTESEFKTINIKRDNFLGELNYSIKPSLEKVASV